MGRGGYHGGSTIVSGAGWATFDPAATFDPIEPAKDDQPKSAPTPKAKPDKSKPGKSKPTKQKREKDPPDLAFQRLQYIGAVIDAALKTLPTPKLPKRARPELRDAVGRAVSVTAWANAQPEFTAILKRKQKRLAAKYAGADGSSAATTETPTARRPRILVDLRATDMKRREALRAERTRLARRVIDAEVDIRRSREKIAEIDRLLATSPKSR